MAGFDVGTPILEAPIAEGAKDQHMVLNMGPQHPSTHGVLRLVLEVDGEITDSATGAAAHGHPAQALALAANELGRRGLAIEPGWLVLTGGLTSAVPVRRGMSLAVHFTRLGSIFLSGG